VNEIQKTGIFGGAAIATLILALVVSSPGRKAATRDESLDDLFPDFTDAGQATGLEIVKFDEETSTPHHFKVAKQGNVWVIPSHNNYPADAANRLADAATALIHVKRGASVGESRSSHPDFGVIEPSENLQPGAKGVGQLISLESEAGKKLAELIVGKEVKDRFGMRYVRIKGQDRVYQAKIDGDKLSTKFEDWIERKLLKMNSWELTSLMVDGSDATLKFDEERQAAQIVRTPIKPLQFRYDDTAEIKWSLDDLQPSETLDEQKLNDLRNALEDLKIVDVYRKPQGLADVLAGKSHNIAQEDIRSLAQRGFTPAGGGLVSASGQVVVEMKDGVVYVLRFGNIAEKTFEQKEAERKKAEKQGGAKKEDATNEDSPSAKKDDKEKNGDAKPADKKGDKKEGDKAEEAAGSNRFLFVQAVFSKDLIAKPKLKPVFGEPMLAAKAPAEGDKANKEAKEKTEESKDGPADAKDKPSAKPRQPTMGDVVKELMALEDERLVDEAEFKARRKEVDEANKRAQDEYDEKLKNGEKKVNELNERFADWYYVIDDQMFKKIRIKRADILKAPEKAADGKKPDEQKSDEKSKEDATEKSARGEKKDGE
jgi:hypothetical protein